MQAVVQRVIKYGESNPPIMNMPRVQKSIIVALAIDHRLVEMHNRARNITETHV